MRCDRVHLRGLLGLLAALVLSGCGGPAARSTETAITLSPSSGGPGTMVTVRGYVPHITAQRQGPSPWGQIGFGGFAAGIVANTHATWSTKHLGHFTAVFRVPETAWWTAQGERKLAPGAYAVALRCFGVPGTKPQQQRCLSGPNQFQATFTLVGSVPSAPSDATVTLSPVRAVPGERVAVTGWAPLTRLFGQPLGYSLMWGPGDNLMGVVQQALNGRLSGSFLVPAYLGGAPVPTGPVALTLVPLAQSPAPAVAHTDLQVLAGLQWAQVRSRPIQVTSQPAPMEVEPRAAVVVANGSLWVTGASGATRQVGLSGIATQAQRLGYSTGTTPRVHGVKGTVAFPASLFITVDATAANAAGNPPFFHIPFTSPNLGVTWQAVSPPPGMTLANFAGYRDVGPGVDALWTRGSRVVSVVTTNGGLTWRPASLACPASGPCLLMGPGEPFSPGLGANVLQPIWRPNRQHQWVLSAQGDITNSTLELVSLADGAALLIDGAGPYPVQMTTDGGRTWQSVALPNAPGVFSGPPYQSLLMLPDGALLASLGTGGGAAWHLLPPASGQWQSVPASVLPPTASGLTAARGRLWWYAPGPAGQAVTVHSTPLGALSSR